MTNAKETGTKQNTGRRDSLGRPIYNWKSHQEGRPASQASPATSSGVKEDFVDHTKSFSPELTRWMVKLQRDRSVSRVRFRGDTSQIRLIGGGTLDISKDPEDEGYSVQYRMRGDLIETRKFKDEDSLMDYVGDTAGEEFQFRVPRRRMRKRNRGGSNPLGFMDGFLTRLFSRIRF